MTEKAQKYHGDKEGMYILQKKEIHGKRQWKHKNGKLALWWNKESQNWIIGEQSNKGGTSGTIMDPSNDNRLPTNINSWKFYFEKEKWFGKNKSNWIEATSNEIQFKDMIATNNCWINATSSELQVQQITIVKGKLTKENFIFETSNCRC